MGCHLRILHCQLRLQPRRLDQAIVGSILAVLVILKQWMVALLLLPIYADMADISGLNIWQEAIVMLLNHVAIVEVHLLLAAQSLISICCIVMPIAIWL